ncbi:hypothetical protein [Amycolatopsis sp. SID8362]|uniref:hypothetical protein n=1 Tax=Amycolatopsis sp. SID8362 TaxID=2690346 RepID=UPI001EF17199|nr:hypothetical protein [Amycolatopsis sp. SID8362]
MTVAVLSDVHDVAAADRIVLLGDVLAGPMPVETLTRLKSLGSRAVWVRGNADRELAASARGAGDIVPDPIFPWAAKQLRPGDLPFLGPTARRQPAGLRAHAHAVRAPGRPTADRQPGQHRNALRRNGAAAHGVRRRGGVPVPRRALRVPGRRSAPRVQRARNEFHMMTAA